MVRNMLRKKLGKKGSLMDIIYVATLLIFFGVSALIAYKVLGEINTEVASHTDIPTEAKTSTTAIEGMYPGVIDNTFLLLVVGLCIGALVLASLVRVHPIFLVFYLILLPFVIFLCGALSNIYTAIADQPQFATEASNLMFISTVLTWLPFIVGIFGLVLAVIMYKLWSNAQI